MTKVTNRFKTRSSRAFRQANKRKCDHCVYSGQAGSGDLCHILSGINTGMCGAQEDKIKNPDKDVRQKVCSGVRGLTQGCGAQEDKNPEHIHVIDDRTCISCCELSRVAPALPLPQRAPGLAPASAPLQNCSPPWERVHCTRYFNCGSTCAVRPGAAEPDGESSEG